MMECCESKNIIKEKECLFVQIVLQYMDILG